MNTPAVLPVVTLENCDREPIHIPGLIQSHGALLVFSLGGIATHLSANARALLGPSIPALGEALAAHHFEGNATVHDAIVQLLDPNGNLDALNQLDHAGQVDGLPFNADVRLGGADFDLIVHRSQGRVVIELEHQPAGEGAGLAGFAIKAHRAMDKLKRQSSIPALLALAVSAVRQLTGFDRVIAYRFRHDDSGEVVAEERADGLDSFLGRRYPAGDIPAQARRLYVINTLRLIADTDSTPVALTSLEPIGPMAPALDMSHCVLRAVSPIHIEYLRNLGVGASMSISVVVNGKLWGMLACHHMSALQVPYSVRMACDVLAQIVAANVQSLLASERTQQLVRAGALRARVIEAALHADDTLSVLRDVAPALCEAFGAQALVLAEDGKLWLQGDVSRDAAASLLRWLVVSGATHESVLAHSACSELPPTLAAALGIWCGVLALRYDDHAPGWLVLLRKEQIETISWGGKPAKEYVAGPLGPRLTPRGSFEVWKETVRGTAVPWTANELELGQQLCDELMRAGAARLAEVNRARAQLLAMLGHDLRDPLQSISMAARVLERGSAGAELAGANASRLGQRIQASSSRMARLIGQVLDMSRLESSVGLQLQFAEVDVTRLLDDLLDEAHLAHPGTTVLREAPDQLLARVDADRMSQVFSNLVSNARHHGGAGEPLVVALSHQEQGDGAGGIVQLEVRNVAPPIPEDQLPHLFSAFMRQSGANPRNKSGLGLGLHIAQAIVTGHGGAIVYRHEGREVVFTARFPVQGVPSD